MCIFKVFLNVKTIKALFYDCEYVQVFGNNLELNF